MNIRPTIFGAPFGFSHTGSAPSPFSAINGSRLAGPQGSHPLHGVSASELVERSSSRVSGSIEIDAPVMVGGSIAGTIRVQALEAINARAAALRLVGLRLDEVKRSKSNRDSDGRTTHTEHWVEVDGKLFSVSPFTEPAVPATLAAGEAWEGRFLIPAPQLGPPTAHLGESIIAWALEVRWDVAMAGDKFVAVPLEVRQNRDLIAAGVGSQGGMAMLNEVSHEGGTIAIESGLPAPTGSQVTIRTVWPDAKGGSRARLEIHRRSNAPNGENAVVASTEVNPDSLSDGTPITLGLPDSLAPSFDGAGLKIEYIVRALLDRRFRPDTAIERPIAVVNDELG